MNFDMRIFVQCGSTQKIVKFESLQTFNSIIDQAFSKFQLDEDPQTFSLILISGEKKYFRVEDGEELQNNDHVLLMKQVEAKKFLSQVVTCAFPSKKDLSQENCNQDDDNSEGSDRESYYSISKIEIETIHELSSRDTSEREEEEDIEVENNIEINDLFKMRFESRKSLSKQVNQWASKYKFSLAFSQRERYLLKEECKVSLLECSEKLCPFFLEFKTIEEDGLYILTNYWNSHNHKLNKFNTTKDITEEIFDKIKQLKDSTKDIVKLTNLINKEFKLNFSEIVIRYQIKKIMEEEFGRPSEDAQRLLDLISKDATQRNHFYKKELGQDHQILNICFMTPRMRILANQYNDILIVDCTHKTNRFNLPLMDIVIIDQNGKTCTCFVALLKDQTKESFKWALEAFKSQLKSNPRVIINDEEESLLSGNFFYIIQSYFL